MKALYVLILSGLLALPCFAQSNVGNKADLSGLTDEQKLEVLQQIEKKKAPASPASVDPKKVAEWLNVGEQVAGLVPIFAEKTAIAAQAVLDSTPGRILLGIVLLKMFWGKLMGIFFLTVGLAVWWHMFKKTFLIKEVLYQPHPNPYLNQWLGLRQKTVVRVSNDDLKQTLGNEPLCWAFFVAGVINLLCGLIGITN